MSAWDHILTRGLFLQIHGSSFSKHSATSTHHSLFSQHHWTGKEWKSGREQLLTSSWIWNKRFSGHHSLYPDVAAWSQSPASGVLITNGKFPDISGTLWIRNPEWALCIGIYFESETSWWPLTLCPSRLSWHRIEFKNGFKRSWILKLLQTLHQPPVRKFWRQTSWLG